MTAIQLNDIIEKFQIEGQVLSCAPYGDGHINDTYLLVTTVRKYIMQRINNRVFCDVDLLMNNIDKVLSHAKRSIIAQGGNPEREAMTLVRTTDGDNFYRDGNKFYRMYIFIDKTVALNSARTDADFYESGVAFGKFAGMLDGFNTDEIKDVIPNFHNTEVRFKNFINALELDKVNRAVKVKNEIDFILAREEFCSKIVKMLASGELKWRVTHNDTKLNNVLLDEVTGKAVSVIDLDTVMKGSVCYDFGDSVRFGCSTALEDEEDLDKVHFSLPLFDVYSRGFLGALDGKLLKSETLTMPIGSMMMTLECGIRFLTDYLDGDNYFKVSKNDHNLHRCRTQFKLVSEMEQNYDEMLKLVERFV
ncbi:MAG: aminoglycoside phosphotransferase family protein [Clostridia bacterium]|nr:aminoglycoside phosphotransferase family protein [Clostridia bacterium]